MELSEHFTLEEATHSDTAIRLRIKNEPNLQELLNMKLTAKRFEEVRTVLDNKPIHVNSWLRVSDLNHAIGGSKTSQHPYGEAIDFTCASYGSPLDICRAIIAAPHIKFDQLILEHTWVHISFAIRSGNPRGQVLSLLGNKKYAVGLTDKDGTPYN